MSPAEQGEVGEVGCPAVGPMDQVVGVAPMRRSRAPRETAPRIPQPQRRQLPRRRQPSRATLFKNLPAATQDGGNDVRVARQPTHRLRRDQGTALGRADHGRRTCACRQIVIGHREHQRGLHPRGWPVAGAGGAAAYLDQRLPTTQLRAARVAFTIGPGDWGGQRADRRLQRRRSNRVENQLVGQRPQLIRRRAREGDEAFRGVGVSLELTIRPVGRQQRGPQGPDTLRSVSDAHVQQTLEDGRGGFLTKARLQPSEFADHRESRRHAHLARDCSRQNTRQVRASTLADKTGDLPRATPGSQGRRVLSHPPSSRPGLRRRDLPTRLRLTNDRDPSTARDRSESV
jgi:hypothetical protein